MSAVERLLGELVGFPTVSDQPLDGLAGYLADRLARAGLDVQLLPSPSRPGKTNVVASAGPKGTDGLLLTGHLDVVPVDGQPWTSDPFALTPRGDRLLGRGTCDMKGFVAACLAAADRLDLDALDRELLLVFTHDEEVGCVGSRELADRWLAEQRPVPSVTLVGEPTGFQILRMHSGHIGFEITITGQAAHSSKPELGVSAVAAAAGVVELVHEVAADLRRERHLEGLLDPPYVPLHVGTIRGGTAINIVPDRCVVGVGYRPLPGMDDRALYRDLMNRVRQRLARYPGTRVQAEVVQVVPSMATREGTALQALLEAHAHGPCGAAPFATDGGNLARLGTEPLIFGPGRIDLAHQPDESIGRAELATTVDLLVDLVHQRCGRR